MISFFYTAANACIWTDCSGALGSVPRTVEVVILVCHIVCKAKQANFSLFFLRAVSGLSRCFSLSY